MEVVNSIWSFFQDQILGMKWLNGLIGKGLSQLGLDIDSRLGGSIQFFLYDVIKITILLCLLIFFISYIQSYFPPERSKKILGRFHGIGANIISALLGTVAFAYVIVGLIIAVIGGTFIENLHMEKYVEDFVKNASRVDISSPALTKKDRVQYAKEQVMGTFKKVFPYILIGVGIGAIIHNWIPETWIESILGSNNPFGVVLATLVGIPMYADIFGTIPVAEALLAKGAQLGTILSFMMAVTTLSLPSLIMLKKAVKPKLLTLFIAICTSGIIIVGYLFNIFSAIFI